MKKLTEREMQWLQELLAEISDGTIANPNGTVRRLEKHEKRLGKIIQKLIYENETDNCINN